MDRSRANSRPDLPAAREGDALVCIDCGEKTNRMGKDAPITEQIPSEGNVVSSSVIGA
jgi:hypothetical protein